MIDTTDGLESVSAECRKLVTRRSLAAAAAAVVPIPGADLAADIGLLANLLPTISAKFGLDHDQVRKLDPHVAQQVLVVAASLENNVIGRTVSRSFVVALLRRVGVRIAAGSVVKFVPILGSALAATISFGAMKLVGDAHIRDCHETIRTLIAARIGGHIAVPNGNV